MNPHFHYILAQQHIADLQRDAEHARLATETSTRRRGASPIVRALPMPTAHPSPEAWPAASLPAGVSPVLARPGARPAPCRASTDHKPSTGARVKAARVPLTRDQGSAPESGAAENDCGPRSSLATGMS